MINPRSKNVLITLFIWLIIFISTSAFATSYYVDATNGLDTNAGTSTTTSWKTIGKVNASQFSPGDQILFKRGEVWREPLTVPSSGAVNSPITFGAYGQGNKPKLLGSAAKSNLADWTQYADNKWVVAYSAVGDEVLPNPSFDTSESNWLLYSNDLVQANAAGSRDTSAFDSPPASFRVQCINPGITGTDIQLFTMPFALTGGESYKLVFRAKSSIPFTIPTISVHMASAPYTRYSTEAIQQQPVVTTNWAGYSIYFRANRSATDARLTFYLGNALPGGATFNIDSVSLRKCGSVLDSDVGNLVFNDGAAVGRKVWNESDLTQQGDFWYDEENQTVKVFSSVNPALYYGNIECALKWETGALIYINAKSYIVIQDLDIRYAGAHGIQAVGSGNIIVRSCDLSFIGGSKQYGNVRYGNGVEFWDSNHDTTVEYCRLDQIYDAAVTTQGSSAGNQKVNQNFHYNIITNSEYAFEFWNHPSSSSSQNITFQNNTCAYAGMGWGHDQRSDPTGYHIVFYQNTAATNGIFIRNNIFYEAARSSIFVDPVFSGLSNVDLDYNVYYQSSGNTINFQGVQYDAASFNVYQTATQEDAHSVVHDPLFTGPSSGNFQLGSGSPCFGAGVNVGLTKDFNGVPVAADNVDIGALQRTLLRAPTSLRIVAAP